jgi:nucleoid-associated protein YgaU
MRGIVNVALVAVAAAAVALGAGCSKTTGRSIDVSAGEYYTEAEFEKLSNEQKAAYCTALEAERERLQAQVTGNQGQLQATRKEIEGLRGQITPTEREILRLDAEIRTLTSQINQMEALPREYTVQPNDCLSIISERNDVYADAWKWPRIYRANLDKIEDPVWIYPGQVLAIPRELPGEHKVAPYETLEIIAGYWEVYGDPSLWARLYEANKDKVKDPFDLEPGIVLVIPR